MRPISASVARCELSKTKLASASRRPSRTCPSSRPGGAHRHRCTHTASRCRPRVRRAGATRARMMSKKVSFGRPWSKHLTMGMYIAIRTRRRKDDKTIAETVMRTPSPTLVTPLAAAASSVATAASSSGRPTASSRAIAPIASVQPRPCRSRPRKILRWGAPAPEEVPGDAEPRGRRRTRAAPMSTPCRERVKESARGGRCNGQMGVPRFTGVALAGVAFYRLAGVVLRARTRAQGARVHTAGTWTGTCRSPSWSSTRCRTGSSSSRRTVALRGSTRRCAS